MARLLFIGSTVADVVLRTPCLPVTGQDVNLLSQRVSLGGCAYNAFHTARLTGQADCTLFSPIGSGVWGDFVRRSLAKRGVVSAAPQVDEPNGCCYCLVEPDGERTFLCEHGAEYRFQAEWFDALAGDWDGVYLCGLEVEEDTGENILRYLEAHPPKRLYFAPGPRLIHIPPSHLARVFALSPLLHLNKTELEQFTREEDISRASAMLHALTEGDVVVTLGARGAYARLGDQEAFVPGVPARVVDTIGAGDSHIGALMAALADGLAPGEALLRANRVAAAVVSQEGAELSPETWARLSQNL